MRYFMHVQLWHWVRSTEYSGLTVSKSVFDIGMAREESSDCGALRML